MLCTHLFPKIFENSPTVYTIRGIKHLKKWGYHNQLAQHQRIFSDLPPTHFVSCLMFAVSPIKVTVTNVCKTDLDIEEGKFILLHL